MQQSTLLIIVIALLALYFTRQTFWVIVAGLLVLAYAISISTKTVGKGVRKTTTKLSSVVQAEFKEMEGQTGKYPSKFFDSAGKAIMEKGLEFPKGAKSYKEADNSKWAVYNPAEKIADVASKFLDGLGKLFSK